MTLGQYFAIGWIAAATLAWMAVLWFNGSDNLSGPPAVRSGWIDAGACA